MTAEDSTAAMSSDSAAGSSAKVPEGVAGAPNEAALLALMERTGYSMLRLMMDFDGKNRGYAFVMYCHKHEAKRAVRELNNYEIRPGRLLGVCCSVDNCRLFIGGIPKMKKREEILEEIAKVTEGVLDLWGHQIAVDWAEPEIDVDEDVMETVKILYVRNLMIETTEDTIKKSFGQFNPGCVERVKKIRDYAFVHFASREDAVHAMNNLNGTELEGSCLEVTLAKPVDKEQYSRYQKAAKGGGAAEAAMVQQPSYVYSCDPYTLAYYGYPYNALIGPNRDYFVKVAIPAIGAQYSMFQAAPAPKMIEDGKIHTMEHMISPITVQPDPAAAAAAAAAVIPAVSTPPPFQGRPITPVYTVAPNVQRIPAAGIYGASYVPFAAPTTATIATLQKNAAAAVYSGYAGYIPQAFPAAAIQVPIHDVYQTY
ncbi:hypothetical protein E2I00_012151 [Balaenoptera physalus]|uniref:RRM domain-containing protein n=1 Tax=Balaenoptera physalus TaxID=9770 RepID=A0A643C6A4_BALPH|nr:hypothetical protein E2I00_012151 [Balaenoptera physalus]